MNFLVHHFILLVIIRILLESFVKFLDQVIVRGKIPYFSALKKIVFCLWPLAIFAYFFINSNFKDYGELGWSVLIAVMLIRPLADVFPDLKILRSLVILRKEFGILAGVLIVIHSYGYFHAKNQNLFFEIFNPQYWHFGHPFLWGLLGFLITLLLLLTSNRFSVRLLKRHWKKVQLLAYPLFFFSAIHIALVKKGEAMEVLLPVLAVSVLWAMARFKVKISVLRNQLNEERRVE